MPVTSQDLTYKRKCKVFCYKCLSNKYPIEVANYYMLVDPKEVRTQYNPIVNNYIPFARCQNCGEMTARITSIEKIKSIQEGESVLDKFKLTREQYEKKQQQNLSEYTNKVGVAQAKKDFVQPFSGAEGVNMEFVNAYKSDENILLNAYTPEQLEQAGAKELSTMKKKGEAMKAGDIDRATFLDKELESPSKGTIYTGK